MRYLFEDFALDTDRCELIRRAAPVAVEPQVFDLLLHLIRHRDRVVTKDDLLASVWHGRIVSESTLFNRINRARRAVGDTGVQQRLIKTVTRKGFRFVGEVREAHASPAAAAAPAGRGPPLGERAAGAERVPPPRLDLPSLAILPFANMSGDPAQDHIADGMSEDLITGLSRIRWLLVIARNSTFVYRRRAVDVKQVARELGVRYVLEGSVQRAGRRLRVSAQLIDAANGGHLWAERYDRSLGDIFALQDEIARSVAGAIEPHLLAAEGARALARAPDDLGAWECVARAQIHLWRMTPHDSAAAVALLRPAVERFPEYAPAHSLLAFCLGFAVHMGWVGREQGLKASRGFAASATALDDSDPWAHIALGYVSLVERRTEESIAAFRRAVCLHPHSAAAHAHLGHGLVFAGQDREGIDHAEAAIRLSPLDPMKALFLGTIAVGHFTAGRYAEAVRFTTEAARLRPGFLGAQRMRCASLAQAGRIDEARLLLGAVRREQPQLSAEWIRSSVPYQTPELMENFVEGMRKAGLRQ